MAAGFNLAVALTLILSAELIELGVAPVTLPTDVKEYDDEYINPPYPMQPLPTSGSGTFQPETVLAVYKQSDHSAVGSRLVERSIAEQLIGASGLG